MKLVELVRIGSIGYGRIGFIWELVELGIGSFGGIGSINGIGSIDGDGM